MSTIIKFIISIFLIGCLFRMPYNYYQIVRVVAFIGFVAISYLDIKRRFYYFLIITIAGAILFNPINEFTFPREVWQQIDRCFAAILLGWGVIETIRKKSLNVG